MCDPKVSVVMISGHRMHRKVCKVDAKQNTMLKKATATSQLKQCASSKVTEMSLTQIYAILIRFSRDEFQNWMQWVCHMVARRAASILFLPAFLSARGRNARTRPWPLCGQPTRMTPICYNITIIRLISCSPIAFETSFSAYLCLPNQWSIPWSTTQLHSIHSWNRRNGHNNGWAKWDGALSIIKFTDRMYTQERLIKMLRQFAFGINSRHNFRTITPPSLCFCLYCPIFSGHKNCPQANGLFNYFQVFTESLEQSKCFVWNVLKSYGSNGLKLATVGQLPVSKKVESLGTMVVSCGIAALCWFSVQCLHMWWISTVFQIAFSLSRRVLFTLRIFSW